jgi:hypothetical protein
MIGPARFVISTFDSSNRGVTKMSTCEKGRTNAKLDRAEESEQITDDDGLPELVTDSDTDLEDNKRPELGTGKEEKPNPALRRARPPARPHRKLKPRELKLPELPTGKPPIPEGSDKTPRRRFTQGTVPLREVPKYQFRRIPPVHPSAPAAVDHL